MEAVTFALLSKSLRELLHARLIATADLFASVSKHPVLVGSGREQALRDLLEELTPRRYEALHGGIAGPAEEESLAHQLDLMLVDTMDYPVVVRAGKTAIVLPQAVRALIEIKSEMKKAKFSDAIEQVGAYRLILEPDGGVLTAVLSYGGPAKTSTLRSWLAALVDTRPILRQQLIDAANGDAKKIAQRLSSISALALPDVYVSNRGPVAIKREGADGPHYQFFKARKGGRSIMAFVAQIVTRVGVHVQKLTAEGNIDEAYQLIAAYLDPGLVASKDEPLPIGDPAPLP